MSGTILYFAYGSNMLTHRLAARCPGARMVDVVTAEDHALIMTLPGGGPSGKAGLVRREGASAPGVLYALTATDAAALQAHEGASYRRVEAFTVLGRDIYEAMAYLPVEEALHEQHPPFDWYRALVIAGVRQHALGVAHLEAIEAVEAVADPEPDRPQRRDAIAALEAAGYGELVEELA